MSDAQDFTPTLITYLFGQGFRWAEIGVLLILLLINLFLTALHSYQEFRGRLWRYFGAIEGVFFPNWLGWILFTLFLTVTLWAFGFLAFGSVLLAAALTIPSLAPFTKVTLPVVDCTLPVSTVFVGLIVGGRISDTIFSHRRLNDMGFKPNPGLESTAYYLIETGVILVLFAPALFTNPGQFALGFAPAFAFFVVARPVTCRPLELFKCLKHDPWIPGEELPAWARK